jgi:predicted nuclease of predicted toxin-antitoxin system
MMKFKTDENLPIEVAEMLEEAGYDALSIWDQEMVGSDDPAVAKVCQDEGRCLITLDKDFADIRTYPPEDFAGLMILRVKTQDKPTILALVKKIITLLPHTPVDKHLWIVEERRVRVRGDVYNLNVI